MISQEGRERKTIGIHDIGTFTQSVKDLSISVFKKVRVGDVFLEIKEKILDESICAIVEDDKKYTQSNYVAIFITDAGGFIAVNCFIDDDKIRIFNVKNILIDDYSNWYISRYKKVGETRELASLSISFESATPKDLKGLVSNT